MEGGIRKKNAIKSILKCSGAHIGRLTFTGLMTPAGIAGLLHTSCATKIVSEYQVVSSMFVRSHEEFATSGYSLDNP